MNIIQKLVLALLLGMYAISISSSSIRNDYSEIDKGISPIEYNELNLATQSVVLKMSYPEYEIRRVGCNRYVAKPKEVR